MGQMAADVPKPRNIKKYVIIAVTSTLSVAVALTAILVGMYMFTQAEKELLKVVQFTSKNFSLTLTHSLSLPHWLFRFEEAQKLMRSEQTDEEYA